MQLLLHTHLGVHLALLNLFSFKFLHLIFVQQTNVAAGLLQKTRVFKGTCGLLKQANTLKCEGHTASGEVFSKTLYAYQVKRLKVKRKKKGRPKIPQQNYSIPSFIEIILDEAYFPDCPVAIVLAVSVNNIYNQSRKSTFAISCI